MSQSLPIQIEQVIALQEEHNQITLVPQKNGMDVKGTVVQWSMVVVVLRVLFFVLINPLIEKCILFVQFATGKRLTREEFKARGNRMQRAGQANAVPVNPFKNNKRLRQQSIWDPRHPLRVNRNEECVRQ